MLRRILPFKKSVFREALLAHADSLIRGQDDTARPQIRRKPARQALEGLFGVAERVRDALPPVDPADTFVADLRSRLADMRAEQMARVQRRRERRRMAWQIAGVTGLLLSGLAMVALGVRFIITIISRYRTTAL